LLDVVEIVAGHTDGQIPDGNAATLGMDARALPLFRADLPQKTSHSPGAAIERA